MLADKVQEHFSNPLSSRVLIYFDKSGAYQKEVDNWPLLDVVLLTAGERYLHLKTKLHYDLRDRKVFLYFPFAKPTGEKWKAFPMLSTYYANTELLMDEQGQFIKTYGLQAHQLPLVKKYWAILSTSNGQKTLAKVLTSDAFTEVNLKRGLIAHYLDMPFVPDSTLCLVRLITLHQKPKMLQKAIKKIRETNLEDVVLGWISNYFGERMPKGLSLDGIQRLAQKIKYNVIVGAIESQSADHYHGKYRIKDTIVRNSFNTFWVDWKNSTYSNLIPTVFKTTAKDIQEEQIIKWYGVEHSYGYYTEAMSVAVLQLAFEQVEHQPKKVNENLINWLNQTVVKHYSFHFEALKHIASVLMLLSENATYIYNTLDEYVNQYSSHWYKVDAHYRQAIWNYDKLSVSPTLFEDSFSSILEVVHKKYDLFLIRLNKEWIKLLNEQSFDYSKIKTPKQYDYFESQIADKDHKLAVIISDGLRYEVGVSLYEELLKSNDRVTVEISPMLASIPSYTKLGMANLLPNKGMTVSQNDKKDDLDIRINDISTEGTYNRTKILQQHNAQANAESYDTIIKLSLEEGRTYFKKHPLTYIYHNTIDTIADNIKSQSNTFSAVAQTIDDLKKLINKLRNSWNVYYIYIISDHGFLYNHQDISEASKEEMPKEAAVWGKHSRFLMSDKGFQFDKGYSFALNKTTNIKSDIQVHLPNTINRFKRQGSGKQYVHGGGSLQELVIPSIFYYKKRDDADLEYVDVVIVNKKNLKITSNTLKLQFLQSQAVSSDYKKTIWLAGIYSKEGVLLSNEEVLVFDKTSENPAERMQVKSLQFSTTGSNSSICYLRIFDWNGKNPSKLNPIFEQHLINNSLINKDF